ncbi:putative DsbA family dithiol-disulfide isomerase [Plantactinospora soyae]|uniref:DsbA family dithiol-disulfide isomerase n=2 Tax=Plantactinospora soyae TaxID=1544732 RepID=A0A927MBG5_9ACTN|nr:putative DsbA family dithiol-disulfide isomerase [Plantactinospora soyae]
MKVEIYADILCPWCYIGKRRLATALAKITDRDRMQIVWRSYQPCSTPTTPKVSTSPSRRPSK